MAPFLFLIFYKGVVAFLIKDYEFFYSSILPIFAFSLIVKRFIYFLIFFSNFKDDKFKIFRLTQKSYNWIFHKNQRTNSNLILSVLNMKKTISRDYLVVKIIFGLFLFGFFNSCTVKPDDLSTDNYFKIKDKEYHLNYALIEDYGTDYEITSRSYTIGLQSGNSDYPSNFMKFSILSTSTTRLNEGIYEFGYNSPGTFCDLEIGTELRYDDTFVAVSGERIYVDSELKNGTIEISKKNGDYVFEFDFELKSVDGSYHIIGYFTDVLHEETIYY